MVLLIMGLTFGIGFVLNWWFENGQCNSSDAVGRSFLW